MPARRLELAGIRRSALVILILLALIPVAAVVWAVSRAGGSAPPTPAAGAKHASRTTVQHHATGTAPPHASATAPPASPLLKAVDDINVSVTGQGLVPPSSCKAMSASVVTCAQPIAAIATATFQTYPSLGALYAAYEARVGALARGPFRANFGNCTETLTNGEVGWNHDFEHPRTYPLSDFTSGRITDDQAAGRVYCTFDNSMLHLVWTQDDGLVLGELSGAPHEDAYVWWRQIHDSIVLGGFPGIKSTQGAPAKPRAKSGHKTKG